MDDPPCLAKRGGTTASHQGRVSEDSNMTEAYGDTDGRSDGCQRRACCAAINCPETKSNRPRASSPTGGLEADNNFAENAMRSIALGRNYPHLRVMRSSPRRHRKHRACATLSASCATVHPAHNPDLLSGPFHQSGGQDGPPHLCGVKSSVYSAMCGLRPHEQQTAASRLRSGGGY
jgi:hypothetical protein